MEKALNYLTSAAVVWNEVWQGHLQDWTIVNGYMLEAAKHIDDPEIKQLIEYHAKQFRDMLLLNDFKKYRPPFEAICSGILGHYGHKLTNFPKDTTNCIECAVKHVSTAQSEWDARNYYAVIGNLNAASCHLIMEHESIAKKIRNERIKFFQSVVETDKIYRPTFELVIDELLDLVGEREI